MTESARQISRVDRECINCGATEFTTSFEGFTVCRGCGAVQNGDNAPLTSKASQAQENQIHPHYKNSCTAIGSPNQTVSTREIQRLRKWNQRASKPDYTDQKRRDFRMIIKTISSNMQLPSGHHAEECVRLFDEINQLDTSQKTYKNCHIFGPALFYIKQRRDGIPIDYAEVFDHSELDRSTFYSILGELTSLRKRFDMLDDVERAEFPCFYKYFTNLYEYKHNFITNYIESFRIYCLQLDYYYKNQDQTEKLVRNASKHILRGTEAIIAASLSRVIYAEQMVGREEKELLDYFRVSYGSVQTALKNLFRAYNIPGFKSLKRSSHLIIKLRRQILEGKPRKDPIPPPISFLCEYRLRMARLKNQKFYLMTSTSTRSRVRRSRIITVFTLYFHKFMQLLYYAYIVSILQCAFLIQSYDFNSRVMITGKDPPLICEGRSLI